MSSAVARLDEYKDVLLSKIRILDIIQLDYLKRVMTQYAEQLRLTLSMDIFLLVVDNHSACYNFSLFLFLMTN